MIRFALASLAALVLALPAAAQVVVKGDWVALGDVAPVTGDAAKILVTAAPPPGETLALDPDFLTAVAKKAGVQLMLPPGKPVWVTRAGSRAAIATVAPAPPARTPPTVASPGAALPGSVLVLVRDVARGAVLTETDLDWADAASVRAGRNPPADLEAAIGLEAKRTLKAGMAVQMMDLKAPSLIKKGEPVKLVYAAPGLRLTVDGLAQNDAAEGESVRVLNNFSKRTIEAVASASGEARVLQR